MIASRSTRQAVLFGISLTVFLSCHGKGGEAPRALQAGTTSADCVTAGAVDSYGNIYVAGYTYGGLDGNVNADPSGSTADLFIVKYDAKGAKLWTRQMGTPSDDLAFGVAADMRGNIYVAGYTSGGLDGNVNAGSADLFLIRYDAEGRKKWTRQMGSAADDVANGVAADLNGNIYVAGYTSGDLDGNVNAGLSDFFLVKYDVNGVKRWTRQEGTAADDAANAVALDGYGNIYVAGDTSGDLGGTSAGASDLFVSGYRADGTRLWTRQRGTPFDDHAFGVAADGIGNVYIAGSTFGGLDGNVNADPSGATADMFVMRYSALGTRIWTRQRGTRDDDFAFAVSAGANGAVYVAGDTAGGLDGYANADPTGESPDYFLTKYDTTGLWAWTRQAGSRSADTAVAVAGLPGGNVYLAGYTYGWLDGNIPAGDADLFLAAYDEHGVKQ